MTKINSFLDVIDLWPSPEVLASEIDARAPAVAKWRQRNSIPAERWSAILSTSIARKAGVTSKKLVELAATRERPRARA